jgi:Bacterial mobilisation protein (MobC)
MEVAHPKGGNRRSPGEHWRTKTITVRFTDGELTAVRAAAERAGMAVSAWVGELAVDAAEHRAMPPGWLHREMMTELVHLRSQIVWVGNNVNQIARAINSGIVPDMDLHPVLTRLTEVADSIEQAAEKVRRRM